MFLSLFSPLQNVKAIEEGDLRKLKFLEFIGLFNADNIYALDLACKYGHKNIIDYLTSSASWIIIFLRACHKGLNNIVKYAHEQKNINISPCHITYCLENRHYSTADYLNSKAPHLSYLIDPTEYGYIDEIPVNILEYLVTRGLFITREKIQEMFIKGCMFFNFNLVKYCVSLECCDLNTGLKIVSRDLDHFIGWRDTKEIPDIINLLLKKGADYNNLGIFWKKRFLKEKYYRRWRLIHWKNWFCKVVTPLYYSPGFNGSEKAIKELQGLTNDTNSSRKLGNLSQ